MAYIFLSATSSMYICVRNVLMTACLFVLKYIAASILHMHISIWGYTELITCRIVIYLALLMNGRKHPEQFACMYPKADCIH